MKKQITTKLPVIALLLTSVVIAACSMTSPNNTNSTEHTNKMASQIFKNGKIYTVNKQQAWANAVAIRDNKIIFVGSNAEVEKYVNSNTKVTDLGGRMMMPGFHDVHIHPIESASENTLFSLDTDEVDVENYSYDIEQAAIDNPDALWLIGYGPTISTLLDSERAPKDIIDEVVSDRPVIIMEQTSHSMWVNSKALEMAGITINSEDPIGGVIVRDEMGEPTGILIDNAGNIVMDIAMTPTVQSMENDYLGLVEYTLPELAKHGITSISDARSFWQRDDHLTWQEVEKNDELTARVAVGLWAYPNMNDEEQFAQLQALYQNSQNSFLKFNQIKLYSDGILVNGTAAMLAPYRVDLLGLPGNKGLNYFDEKRLTKYIKRLESTGFDFHIHAIGDRGIHEALNAVEQGGSKQGRHRITHIEVVEPSDLPRFAQLNVTADAQVAGEFASPDHWHENDKLIGAVRSDNAIPIKSLHKAGARVTLSSDWNVSPFNPFIGLQNAITRAPQELTLAQAIKAYTLNSAYVMRQEDSVGSIEVGKLADLVVLDRNLFEIDENTINQTKVFMTIFDGETIFQQK
jgi:predicted amidohydrolase YtcJ